MCIEFVCAWCEANKLNVNTSKTNETIVRFTHDNRAISPLTIHGNDIERVYETKRLGVMLTSNLLWSTHCEYIHFLALFIRSGLSVADQLTYYNVTIRPVL